MSDSAVTPFDRRKFFLRLSIASLAVAGILAAGGVFIGGEAWKASSTAGLVFLLNLLVLISFVSRHRFLRYAQWIAIPIIGLLSAVFIWAERPEEIGLVEYWNMPRSDFDAARDWSIGFWWIVAALALLSFFSKGWPLIRQSKFLRGTYYFTFAVSLLAALVAWFNVGITGGDGDGIVITESVMVILALTGASIIIISAFVERSRLRNEEAEVKLAAMEPKNLEALVDSRIEAYLTDPANRAKITALLNGEEKA